MKTTSISKTPGPMSRTGLYSYTSKYTKEAIDAIVNIMRTTRNESLKLGAAKALLDKNLPDLRATEVTGEDHGPLIIKIVSET